MRLEIQLEKWEGEGCYHRQGRFLPESFIRERRHPFRPFPFRFHARRGNRPVPFRVGQNKAWPVHCKVTPSSRVKSMCALFTSHPFAYRTLAEFAGETLGKIFSIRKYALRKMRGTELQTGLTPPQSDFCNTPQTLYPAS